MSNQCGERGGHSKINRKHIKGLLVLKWVEFTFSPSQSPTKMTGKGLKSCKLTSTKRMGEWIGKKWQSNLKDRKLDKQVVNE